PANPINPSSQPLIPHPSPKQTHGISSINPTTTNTNPTHPHSNTQTPIHALFIFPFIFPSISYSQPSRSRALVQPTDHRCGSKQSRVWVNLTQPRLLLWVKPANSRSLTRFQPPFPTNPQQQR